MIAWVDVVIRPSSVRGLTLNLTYNTRRAVQILCLELRSHLTVIQNATAAKSTYEGLWYDLDNDLTTGHAAAVVSWDIFADEPLSATQSPIVGS